MQCDVCNEEPSVGVASSCLGPVSIALGKNCLREGYEPMWVIIGALMGLTSFAEVNETVTSLVRKSLVFHGVEETALWEQVAAADAAYWRTGCRG